MNSYVVSALKMPTKGHVYPLAQLMENKSPSPEFHGPFNLFTYHTLNDKPKNWSDSYRAMNVRLEMTDHHGTHIDSLNHIGIGFSLYGGIDGREITTENGTTKLGIETVEPLITRGVMVDVARYRGEEIISRDFEITKGETLNILKSQETKVPKRGDVVLFRTGYGRLWNDDKVKYISPPIPGISLDVADWAISQGVTAVGADTSGVEYMPPRDPPEGHLAPVHMKLIASAGIYLMENLRLETLSETKIYEFLFICAPLKLKGATASPITPLAIV